MTDQPFHLKVTKDNIVAAMERDDYAWPGEGQHPPEITAAGWYTSPPQ